MLQPFETMSQQCCDAVLREKSLLGIVTVTFSCISFHVWHLFTFMRSTRTCRCPGKWPFFGSSIFGSEESMWSEITDPFFDSPKKRTQRPKATTSSALMYSPQVNKIPLHFIHEIKTKGYDVIGVKFFHPQVNEIPPQERGLIRCLHRYWCLNQSRSKVEIPGRARREERLSRSKLKKAFLIDSDAELFMYLHLCSSMY